MKNLLIPKQYEGAETNVSSSMEFENFAEAILFFGKAKSRLFDVNRWSEISGNSTTTFQLTDSLGNDTSILVEGSFIKIDIPGPGTVSGGGFDWVRVEEISHQSESSLEDWVGFRVRPCHPPNKPELPIAHFFTDKATSTFLIRRVDHKVIAEVHGRNEIANSDADRVFDNVRNILIGTAAKIGFSYPNWKLLVAGIVEVNDEQ